jgi:hypothetical protein
MDMEISNHFVWVLINNPLFTGINLTDHSNPDNYLNLLFLCQNLFQQ